MANGSLASQSLLDAGRDMNETQDWTGFPTNRSSEDYSYMGGTENIIFLLFITIIILFGFVGNGVVIWSLGRHLKRNSFTTFVLNLSAADFGVLLSLFIMVAGKFLSFYFPKGISFFFIFMYITGQMLLTAISVDRCISVLFPIWHRCHRPPHLSTIVCTIIWVISFLTFAIPYIVTVTFPGIYDPIIITPFMVITFLCLPFMVISGLVLSIKVCCKLQQHKRKRLLLTVLLTVFFFLIFGFPLNAAFLFDAFIAESQILPRFIHYSFLFSALNSSVNPLIYFLAGKRKRSQNKENVKIILQRVFRDREV